MATKKERNARLDEFVQKVEQWSDVTQRRLQAEADQARRILKGRKGAESINSSATTAAQDLITAEFNELLTG